MRRVAMLRLHPFWCDLRRLCPQGPRSLRLVCHLRFECADLCWCVQSSRRGANGILPFPGVFFRAIFRASRGNTARSVSRCADFLLPAKLPRSVMAMFSEFHLLFDAPGSAGAVSSESDCIVESVSPRVEFPLV